MKSAHLRHKARTRRGQLTGQRKLVLVLFGLAFLVMVYGVIPWEDLGIGIPTLWWWFPEMTASFLLFAIMIGLVGRMSEKDLTESFVNGSRDLLGVALVVGMARGISVIMNNGMITDTVLHWCEKPSATRQAGFAIAVRAVYAAVVPDPVVLRSGDGRDADHGPAGDFRRCAGRAGRDRLPVRQRVC